MQLKLICSLCSIWYRSLEKQTFQFYTGTCIRPPWDSSPLLDLFSAAYTKKEELSDPLAPPHVMFSVAPVKAIDISIYFPIMFWSTFLMEQLHILRCQVWKSHLCPNRPISVQRFKEAVRWLWTHFYDIITVWKSFHFVNNNNVNVWPIFRNRNEFVTIFLNW